MCALSSLSNEARPHNYSSAVVCRIGWRPAARRPLAGCRPPAHSPPAASRSSSLPPSTTIKRRRRDQSTRVVVVLVVANRTLTSVEHSDFGSMAAPLVEVVLSCAREPTRKRRRSAFRSNEQTIVGKLASSRRQRSSEMGSCATRSLDADLGTTTNRPTSSNPLVKGRDARATCRFDSSRLSPNHDRHHGRRRPDDERDDRCHNAAARRGCAIAANPKSQRHTSACRRAQPDGPIESDGQPTRAQTCDQRAAESATSRDLVATSRVLIIVAVGRRAVRGHMATLASTTNDMKAK